MRRNSKVVFVLAALALFVSGCVSVQPWQLTQNSQKWKYANLEATIPDGWMRMNYAAKNMLLITKDGESLQTIMVFMNDTQYKGKGLSPEKKKAEKDMLPQEIADSIIDAMSIDQTKKNFKALENSPAVIGGQDGFKIDYTYSTQDNLKTRCVEYGFKNNDSLCMIKYDAAAQYYFDKDIAVFEKLVSDLKVLPGKPKGKKK
ncbi:MAG: hypothetical protein M0R66_09985 [Candidatus Omnitrophica bacterium]|nr:hypothetical protein [Candidatus Omnitrophota bacterium]